jgi:TonB family protein
MKELFYCFFLLVTYNTNLFAQSVVVQATRDTINLRGFVYDHNGKPIKGIVIKSSQSPIGFDRTKISTATDTNGCFALKGVKFNDTLTFQKSEFYNVSNPIYNKGSRYMIIYLSNLNKGDINSDQPIEISATRRHNKVTPTLRVQIDNPFLHPFTELQLDAEFIGGTDQFIQLVKSNIVYPKQAVENNVEGTVQIEFNIANDGSPVNFKVLKGIGYNCEQAVIDALKMSPKWRPAINNDKHMIATETVSVKFLLKDKKI